MRTKKILKNFSDASDTYLDHSNIQNEAALLLLEKIKQNKINANKIKNILDIGCGPGNYTKVLADYFDKSRIYAFDISDEMVNVAKKNNHNPRIIYFKADGENFDLYNHEFVIERSCHCEEHSPLSLRGAKRRGNLKTEINCHAPIDIVARNDSKIEEMSGFDLITSNATLQWFENIYAPLDIYKKKLNKNGWIIFSVFGPKTFFELNESIQKFQELNFKQKQISIPAAKFRTKEDFENVISKKFDKYKITEKFITKDYENLMDLMKSIKNTGTQGYSSNDFQKIWTKQRFAEIEEIYIEKFSKITATYHLIFCEIWA